MSEIESEPKTQIKCRQCYALVGVVSDGRNLWVDGLSTPVIKFLGSCTRCGFEIRWNPSRTKSVSAKLSVRRRKAKYPKELNGGSGKGEE